MSAIEPVATAMVLFAFAAALLAERWLIAAILGVALVLRVGHYLETYGRDESTPGET